MDGGKRHRSPERASGSASKRSAPPLAEDEVQALVGMWEDASREFYKERSAVGPQQQQVRERRLLRRLMTGAAGHCHRVGAQGSHSPSPVVGTLPNLTHAALAVRRVGG